MIIHMRILLALVMFIWVSPTSAGERVDLLLVLAADVSYSVDAQKFKLQREGYARAITSPVVLKAICPTDWVGSLCALSNGRTAFGKIS